MPGNAIKEESVILDGQYVRLEPLSVSHTQGLCDAVSDGRLWELAVTQVPQPGDVPAFIEAAAQGFATGRERPYAIVDKASGKVAGSTRYMNINPVHRRVEIGYTFLGASFQRTCVNTNAKLLLLQHAFEGMGMNRVELLTDALNETSRNAIARLGAKQEGILRSHMIMREGRIRDSVIFSIVAAEWPAVRVRLHARLK